MNTQGSTRLIELDRFNTTLDGKFVLVPREPTEAMIDSLAKVMYFDQHSIMHDHNDHWRAANQGLYRSFARTAYRAMIAASTKEG